MTQPDSEIDREPDAEIQATANLSPVSPSPVHTAASQVVPALQDTADTIEAMVDAVAAPNGVDEPILDTVPDTNVDVEADAEDVVDDDSFNDAYEDEAAPNAEAQPAAPDTQDDNDDYAKTFDSPIEPDEANDADTETHVEVDTTQSGPNRETDQILDDTTKSEPSTDSAAIQTSAQGDHAAPTTHTGPSSAGTSKPASHQSPADVALESSNSQDASLDINQLVADLTSNSKGLPFTIDTTGSKSQHDPARAGTATSPSSALPSPSSLPPRPPIPHSGSHTLPSHHHPHSHTSPSHNSTDSINTLSTANAAVYNNSTSATSPAQYQAHSYPAQGSDPEYQRMWDQFMADERQYMSEAKWDRFPEGSRIFIGNLSSDKVSKRDVFDIFHRYGRLAQISLKSAYGFVQYHTVEEGQRAIDQLQDSEVKGRRIHLEISKLQDKSKKDRKQSPDRGRGRDGGRRGDKHGSRDDYRSARNQSPRRGNYQSRDDDYGRDRGFHSRARSRSPGYGRHDKGSYRRRSPSPYGRSRGEEESELPRRYGADVPDVQIITQPDVNRDFVAWVEKAFGGKGLKTDVMLLHPRFPKEKVIQRQAVEGGHAVVDLDLRAQNMAKIPCQVFDRSAGSNNVRFDQYVDLDPPTAAEIVVRTKSATAAANYSQPYGSGTSGVYTQHHPAPQPAAPAAYQQPPPSYPPQANNNAVAEIATLMSKMDSATLQQFLATIQGTPQAPAPPVAHNSIPAAPVPAGNQQVDLQAILGALGGNAAQAPQPAYGAPYGGQPGANGAAPAGDQASAAQVQSIMAQLARFRQ